MPFRLPKIRNLHTWAQILGLRSQKPATKRLNCVTDYKLLVGSLTCWLGPVVCSVSIVIVFRKFVALTI